MLGKYKVIGLGLLLTSAALIGTLYYFLSHPHSVSLPEYEITREQEDLAFEDTEETIPTQADIVSPRLIPMTTLSSLVLDPPTKNTSTDEGLFANLGNNSIVKEFKDYLIGSSISNTPWIPKLNIWKEKIEKKENVDPFVWKNSDSPNFKNIKDRCKRAYERESWEFGDFLKKGARRKQYWNLVWSMCSKEGKTIPGNWGGGQ